MNLPITNFSAPLRFNQAISELLDDEVGEGIVTECRLDFLEMAMQGLIASKRFSKLNEDRKAELFEQYRNLSRFLTQVEQLWNAAQVIDRN